ncbi:MAG: NAD(P)/FAD-dependent oxidoreductase [Hyphomicrobiales bacterium]
MSQSGYIDTYFARTRREATEHPPLQEDLEVETLVIGGGLAGSATALDLAERGLQVALIESRRIGWGASGRNGGFASDGFPGGYKKLVAKVGASRARELHAIAQMGHRLLRERIDRYAIACGPVVEGALRCNIADRGDDLLDFRDFMEKTFGTKDEHWPSERVREALGTRRYSDALFNPRTYSVHPLDLNCGMARAAAKSGARVFEMTPAVELEMTNSHKSVLTPHGRVRADRIVLACGGYVEGLDARLSRAVIPIATFVMATEPLGDKLKSAIRIPYAIFDNEVATNYYRPLHDTRILWGGRVLAWEPRTERIAQALRRDMVAFYPSLADAKVEVAWGGMMPFTRHKLPVIGQLAPDVWFATGFGGLGVALTTAAGRLIGSAIGEADERWRLLEAFGLPFAGGKLGRVPAQLIYWRHQLAANFPRLW